MTKTARVVLAVATVLFIGVALREAWTDGITYDEMYAMTSGLTGLTRHDLRATPQHPPLGKIVAGIPVLFLHPNIPSGAAWDQRQGRELGIEFVHDAYVKGKLHR
jgi:hypothetical protein